MRFIRPSCASRWAWAVIALLALSAGVGELASVRLLGLGDPPLHAHDPKLGYMFQPFGSYLRFGNRVEYNAFGMRSPDFSARKEEPSELRVLVLGDSVLNGGALTDQHELATYIVQDRLERRFERRVIVANCATGSWAHEHMLEYLRRFGTFDADIAIVMTNDEDYGDVVGGPFGETRPPCSALVELITRYAIPHATWHLYRHRRGPPVRTEEQVAERRRASLAHFEALIDMLERDGILVSVLEFPHPRELAVDIGEGNRAFARVARSRRLPVYSAFPAFRSATERSEDVYRSGIHPNARGQVLLADVLEGVVLRMLDEPLGEHVPDLAPEH